MTSLFRVLGLTVPAILAIAVHAQPARWVQATEGNGYVVFLDRTSLRLLEAGVVEGWAEWRYQLLQEDSTEFNADGSWRGESAAKRILHYSRVVRFLRWDCPQKRDASLESIWYGPDGRVEGRVKATTELAFNAVVPETIGEGMLSTACRLARAPQGGATT